VRQTNRNGGSKRFFEVIFGVFLVCQIKMPLNI
jgi:hypothetical protein